MIEGQDVLVNVILVGGSYSRVFYGCLIIVDYPLVCASAVLIRTWEGTTYPELIGLSFQQHL
jgi:hypothetical protein